MQRRPSTPERRSALLAVSALLIAATLGTPDLRGQESPQDLPTIEAKTRDMQAVQGFLPLFWDEGTGKLWMEIGRWNEEILYYVSLPAGVGSNDIGLDRGKLGLQAVVEFRRVGPRVLLVQPNYDYRAESANPMERKAVRDAFAESALWGFQVAAATGDRVLVDATDFVIRDAFGAIETLQGQNQGSFRLEKDRSALYLPRTKGFPSNTEIEATITITGDRPGRWLRSVTPTPTAVTMRQHHSFVELPALGEYTPREADPRAGYGAVSYVDYAVPLGEPMEKRFIRRHRLEKQDPSAPVSDPVEPIVYYLDPGTPEPVRSALLEGARWWNQAFEAAGYRDAFQVEMLPEDADPMDVRYNVIQWVHRSTRGWSYGYSVDDPRTGEILKGHVSLGSLRVRQDYLIAEGLLSPYARGDERPPEVEAMALARIRQLSAHEVGHTIGLSHNYIASAQGRASVMDYPHPLVQLSGDGTIDLSDAYDVGIGEWDKVAVTFGYQDFPDGTDEDLALEGILGEARAEGITFLTDDDARPTGSAHPQVHLWDNGTDAAEELERMMEVRRVALDRFGTGAIQNGMPLATIEEALVPLYLHHRYQVEAATKVVGGLEYTYALRGDGQPPLRRLSAGTQRAALEAVLSTLDPSELVLPESVLEAIPPRPPGYRAHQELFPRYTGLVFDAVTPAMVAADMTVGLLLQEERAARLVEQAALDPDQLALSEVLQALVTQAFDVPSDSYEAEIARAVQIAVVGHLMRLTAAADMPQVRAVGNQALLDLRDEADSRTSGASPADGAHLRMIVEEIDRFRARPVGPIAPPAIPDAPPGSPIGDAPLEWLTGGWAGWGLGSDSWCGYGEALDLSAWTPGWRSGPQG